MNWRRQAACVGHDPNWWFPDREGVAARVEYEMARVICLTCPVRQECLDYARRQPEPWGMWGGLTPEERGHRPSAPEPEQGSRACLSCGAYFKAQRKYCNERCAHKARNKRKTEIRRATRPTTRACGICKRSFATKSIAHLFCSAVCGQKARRRQPVQTVACRLCGTSFTSKGPRHKFCSSSCQGKSRDRARYRRRQLSSA